MSKTFINMCRAEGLRSQPLVWLREVRQVREWFFRVVDERLNKCHGCGVDGRIALVPELSRFKVSRNFLQLALRISEPLYVTIYTRLHTKTEADVCRFIWLWGLCHLKRSALTHRNLVISSRKQDQQRVIWSLAVKEICFSVVTFIYSCGNLSVWLSSRPIAI